MKNYYVIFFNNTTPEVRVDIYYIEKTIGFTLICSQGYIMRYSPNKIHPIPYKRLLEEVRGGQRLDIYQNRDQEEVEEYIYKILVRRVGEGWIVKIYEGE